MSKDAAKHCHLPLNCQVVTCKKNYLGTYCEYIRHVLPKNGVRDYE